MLVDELQWILKPKCILDTLFLKSWADVLVAIFTNVIEIYPDKSLIENLLQKKNQWHQAQPYLAVNIPSLTLTTLVLMTLTSPAFLTKIQLILIQQITMLGI